MIRAVAVVVVSALAMSGCGPYHLVSAGQVNIVAAGRIQAKLVRVRGLTFQSQVPLQAVTVEEARKTLERELHTQYTSDELAKLSRVYGALGLVPPGTNLERAYLDLYNHQVAGFYDPIDRRMVLVEGAITPDLLTRMLQDVLRRDFAGELVLAHELTHALQDQYFGLDVGRNDLGEDDAELARHAVYEGDATLAGFAVVLGSLSPSAAQSLAGKLEGIPASLASAYPDIPDAVRQTVAFQYVAGVNFVSWAYQRAGWEGVNALLAHPPFSTEQILHPEKYFVRAEYPLAVRVQGVAPYIQAGWQVVEDSTLGEFTVQVLGEQFLGHTRAQAMAAGWGGDRLLALGRDSDLAIIWLTAWDSEQDAAEFFSGYGAILAAKHPGAAITSEDTVLTSHGAAPYRVERQGTKVLVIEGPLDDELTRAAARIWRHSSYQQSLPSVPLDLAASVPAASSSVR